MASNQEELQKERVLTERWVEAGKKRLAEIDEQIARPASGGGGGGGTGEITLEQFEKMPSAEKTRFYHGNPTQYSAFMDQIRTQNEDKLYNKGRV